MASPRFVLPCIGPSVRQGRLGAKAAPVCSMQCLRWLWCASALDAMRVSALAEAGVVAPRAREELNKVGDCHLLCRAAGRVSKS